MPGRLANIREWEQLAVVANFQPAKMAILCLVSERQLQRHFQTEFRTTPRRWLRKVQCEMARKLLHEGYSTKAAAEALDFANSSHFCREFKKCFGISPQSLPGKCAGGELQQKLDKFWQKLNESNSRLAEEAKTFSKS